MQTMRAIYQSKGQLATAESSYHLDLQPQTHAFYIFLLYRFRLVMFRNKCSSNTVNTVFQLSLRSDTCLGNCFNAMTKKERDREQTLSKIETEHTMTAWENTHWLMYALFEFLFIVLVFHSLSAALNVTFYAKKELCALFCPKLVEYNAR